MAGMEFIIVVHIMELSQPILRHLWEDLEELVNSSFTPHGGSGLYINNTSLNITNTIFAGGSAGSELYIRRPYILANKDME